MNHKPADTLKQFLITLPEGDQAKVVACAKEIEEVLKRYQNFGPIAFALVAHGIAENPFPNKRP